MKYYRSNERFYRVCKMISKDIERVMIFINDYLLEKNNVYDLTQQLNQIKSYLDSEELENVRSISIENGYIKICCYTHTLIGELSTNDKETLYEHTMELIISRDMKQYIYESNQYFVEYFPNEDIYGKKMPLESKKLKDEYYISGSRLYSGDEIKNNSMRLTK